MSVSVYTDTGKKICEGAVGDSAQILTIMPAYSGVYYLTIESRTVNGGSYCCDIDIKSVKKFNKTSVSSTPYSRNFTLSTSKGTLLSSVFSTKRLHTFSAAYLSVLEFDHKAASIFSYKINTPDGSPISATLLSYSADAYSCHASNTGSGFEAGDAVELDYDGTSYLLVYSEGPFTVEADMLIHNEYKIEALTLPYAGALNTSDSSLLYDDSKINDLKDEYPFANVENRSVKLFEMHVDESSVISLLCDRREHKFFSAVSDEYGLSAYSTFPLRRFSEYCSEIDPSSLCYNSFISDSGKMYLCYFGTASSAYVEIFSNKTHTQNTSFAEKYKPGDALPTVSITNLYDDSYVYDKLGIERQLSDATKISGFFMTNADGDHFYASSSSPTVPDDHSKMKLYAVIDRAYNSGREDEFHEYYELYIGEFNADKGFLAPIIEDIAEYIADNPTQSILIAAIIILPTAACTVILIRMLIVKRKKKSLKAEKIESEKKSVSEDGE